MSLTDWPKESGTCEDALFTQLAGTTERKLVHPLAIKALAASRRLRMTAMCNAVRCGKFSEKQGQVVVAPDSTAQHNGSGGEAISGRVAPADAAGLHRSGRPASDEE